MAVCAVAFVLGPRLLNESRDSTVQTFDAPGAVLVTARLSSLVYAITQTGQYGWTSARTLGVFAAALVLLAGFVWWERRQSDRHGVQIARSGAVMRLPDRQFCVGLGRSAKRYARAGED